MSIGERIISLRKEQNLSQGQLADLLSISRQAVSKWENDLSSPDTLNLIRLADVLKTEVEYLATGVKPVYQSPPIIVNLLKKEAPVTEKLVEVERPVVRKLVRVRYVRNPIEFAVLGAVCFLAGLVLGFML